MIETVLKKFGFSEKEILVYLTLLKLGSAPVRSIAERANINRSTTHQILNTFIGDGLVSFVDKVKHRYFTAEPPEHLITLLKSKRNELENTEQELQEVLPELKSLYEKSESRPKAKYFEGKVGVRAIQEDVLASMSRITGDKCYYIISSSTIRGTLRETYPNYNEERIRLGLYVKTISFGAGGKLHGLDERKWLTYKEGAPTYTMLYAGKVALIALDENHQPISVVIEDKNTYQTQVMLFEALWKTIPEPKSNN